MNSATIMQGDQYPLQFTFTTGDSTPPLAQAIGEIEVMLGTLEKTLTSGDIAYDENAGTFTVPLTQQETFAMRAGPHSIQVRIRACDGKVIGEEVGKLIVRAAQSKAVL